MSFEWAAEKPSLFHTHLQVQHWTLKVPIYDLFKVLQYKAK